MFHDSLEGFKACEAESAAGFDGAIDIVECGEEDRNRDSDFVFGRVERPGGGWPGAFGVATRAGEPAGEVKRERGTLGFDGFANATAQESGVVIIKHADKVVSAYPREISFIIKVF